MFDETERSLADRRAKDLHAARVMERHNERMRKEEAKADKDYDKIVSGFGLVAPSMEEAAGDAGAEAVDGSEKVDEAKLEAAVEGVLSRYEGAFDPSTLNAV